MLIDWFTVTAQAVNFLVLVWLLKRFLYKPVLAAIDEREKRIASQLQDAEKKKAEALKEQTDFQHKNEDFDRQRVGLLSEATKAAKTERDKLMEASRKDADELRSKLQKGVHVELDNLNKKIGTLAQQEVFSIARKTLSDLAGVSLEQRMTDIFIQRLQGIDDKQRGELKTDLQASSKIALIRSAFDLTPQQRKSVEDVIKPLLNTGTEFTFETKPELISGIELAVNGQKIAWSIRDYLTSLTNSVSAVLEPKTVSDPISVKVVPHAA
ncbi:MAG: F0F1 ATP synthase subunit delta [Methylacidiphilales bacterium]|nr:F0F1 ATP synthase subunit delta [Candidatus Methylacidiphilales bacterium]